MAACITNKLCALPPCRSLKINKKFFTILGIVTALAGLITLVLMHWNMVHAMVPLGVIGASFVFFLTVPYVKT